MKTIEINTSFNVIIRFNLANVFERGIAYLLDMLIIWAVIGILMLFLGSLSPGNPYLVYFVAIPLMGSYTLLTEILYNGQTPGKMAMRIRVIRLDGQRTRLSDYFMRWIFRLVDIYFSGSLLAILMISTSPKAQRLGDILADTCVIRIRERADTSLAAIVKLNNREDYSATYPEVTQFTETEMLTIQECLERHKQFPNENHVRALNLLVETIEEQLRIRCTTEKTEFLKTLIRDYVMLTR